MDFTRLTPAQRTLLDRGGWTVDTCGPDNVQPSKRTVAKLIARGLVATRVHITGTQFGRMETTEYIVPARVREAWNARRAA